jgi:CMP-N-acetylneuraminic acid synthetase
LKAVCIIPARGGSVRIPRKNIKEFCGVPMLQRTMEMAWQTAFDDVIVSTDDQEIGDFAENWCDVHWRSNDDGTRGTQEIAGDVLGGTRCALACVLYPCTPLLTPKELIHGYQRLIMGGQSYCYSMGKDSKDAGGFYWGWAHAFISGEPLEPNSSWAWPAEHFDINTPEDWDRAEKRWRELHE